MRIPKEDAKRLELYREVREACLASRQDRLQRYAVNRRFYLYGNGEGDTVSPWNKIYSHLDTVSSFFYASDTTRFMVKLGARANKADRPKKEPVAARVMEEWDNSNADIVYGQAILWALIYDTTFVKHIRRGGQIHPFVVDPGSFGVYREDVPMLDRQEAFVHVYYMTPTDLERQLLLHPKKTQILESISASRGRDDVASQNPPIVDRVLMSATSPTMIGEANVPLEAPPEYNARVDVDLIEMSEMWIWDDAIDDYQVVTMASDTAVVYDRENIFIPKSKWFEGEHPFVQVCPNPLYDYFWGVAELARLAPLQKERNSIRDRVVRLIEKQVDPPTAWSGIMGLTEDKMAGLNDPGAQISLGDGQVKREAYVPTIPSDIYSELHQNDADFDDVSGLTNVLAGRGEAGVRSSGHAAKLATLGSSRPKKRSLIIEDSLEKGATIYGRSLYLDDAEELEDEQGHKFVIAQMSPHFTVKVDGHSNSPVFMEDQREVAIALFKAKAIGRKRFIQLMNAPMKDDLIYDLEHELIPNEQAAAKQRMAAEAQKGGLKAVK